MDTWATVHAAACSGPTRQAILLWLVRRQKLTAGQIVQAPPHVPQSACMRDTSRPETTPATADGQVAPSIEEVTGRANGVYLGVEKVSMSNIPSTSMH